MNKYDKVGLRRITLVFDKRDYVYLLLEELAQMTNMDINLVLKALLINPNIVNAIEQYAVREGGGLYGTKTQVVSNN